MKRLLIVALFPLLTLTGCPSVSTGSSARTLQKGKFQFAAAPGVYGAATTAGQTAFLPQLDLQGRYGVTDNFEIGGKLWLLGAAIDGKIALLRPLDPDWGLNLSIDPGIGYFGTSGSDGNGGTTSAGIVTFYVPVLVGIRLAGHELTLGPKVVDMLAFSAGSGGGTTNLVLVGSSLGFSIKVTDSFRIIPEASFLYPVSISSGGSVAGIGNSALVQVGLGFAFGGAEDRRPVSLESVEDPATVPPAGEVAPSSRTL